MNNQFNEARSSVQKARQALRNGDRTQARQWAEHAATLAPQLEDAWLILAAVASPHASLEYIQTALKINPNSPRARQGMQWAMQRLRTSPPRAASAQSDSADTPKGASRRRSSSAALAASLIFGIGCVICVAVLWMAGVNPLLAFLARNSEAQNQPQAWAHVNIPKPTYTPASLAQIPASATSQVFFQPTLAPTQAAIELPTDTPAPIPTDMASVPSPEPTWAGFLSLAVVPDTPTVEIPTNAPLSTAGSPAQSQPRVAGGTRWIDVNLTQQMTYAYEGNTIVNSFLVSTGTWQYPTVTGQYHIYVKLRYTDMAGPGYYLPNVPNTMYFYQSYGLHGTYWHHNFGTPMSHGCVNLSIPDSEWLYDWAAVGTLVNIHY
jgi:lipoprotein-anchoring transpeptidase ErfK/SrfK